MESHKLSVVDGSMQFFRWKSSVAAVGIFFFFKHPQKHTVHNVQSSSVYRHIGACQKTVDSSLWYLWERNKNHSVKAIAASSPQPLQLCTGIARHRLQWKQSLSLSLSLSLSVAIPIPRPSMIQFRCRPHGYWNRGKTTDLKMWGKTRPESSRCVALALVLLSSAAEVVVWVTGAWPE